MEIFIFIVIIFYLLSTVGYFAYLFLQKEVFQQTGFYLLVAGFCCHTATIGFLFIQSGHFPVNNLHEVLTILGWTVAGVFLVFQYRFQLKILGVYAAPLVSFVMVIAARFPNAPDQMNKTLNNLWLVVHVVAVFIGEASFALACGVGLLYLLQEHAIKSKKHGFFFRRLPSLELLDTTGYACILTGFAMLTFGLKYQESCFRFIDHLDMILNLANLGDCKTLIIHPYSSQYVSFPEDLKNQLVDPKLLRFSLGVEHAQDICNDLEKALKAV